MSTKTFPSLSFESELFASGATAILGVDEVGRGALAGPVAVGVTVLSADCLEREWPNQLQDSKLMTPVAREAIFEQLSAWANQWSVGMVTAQDIDRIGITRALAKAASKAMSHLTIPAGAVVILDGSHNWLGAVDLPNARVEMRTKADLNCVSVAAASVLAKVTRDRLMTDLAGEDAYSAFGFEQHKGYASQAHIDALKTYGPTDQHRVTWLGKILENDVLF